MNWHPIGIRLRTTDRNQAGQSKTVDGQNAKHSATFQHNNARDSTPMMAYTSRSKVRKSSIGLVPLPRRYALAYPVVARVGSVRNNDPALLNEISIAA